MGSRWFHKCAIRDSECFKWASNDFRGSFGGFLGLTVIIEALRGLQGNFRGVKGFMTVSRSIRHDSGDSEWYSPGPGA